MEFTKIDHGFALLDGAFEVIAEITYRPTSDPNIVEANHTYVDGSLRGQGVAEKLLDALVADMEQQGKKIRAVCPYVVRKFAESNKYDHIKVGG